MLCFQCETDLNDENKLQCDGCKRNICLDCSNLTSSEVRVMGLKGKRTLLYLCPACREALFQVPKLIKAYDGLREELDGVKELLSRPSVVPGPAPLVCPVVSSAAPLSPSNANAILEEIVERERRANNIILVGIEESNASTGNDRKLHDESSVKRILHDITNNSDFPNKLVTLHRLGRRDDGKPRPIKVVLATRQDAVTVLKNKSKAGRQVRVYDDKTPKQREEINVLRDTLKARIDKGESDLTIKYVRGLPKIVQQKN